MADGRLLFPGCLLVLNDFKHHAVASTSHLAKLGFSFAYTVYERRFAVC
jgi:hypothetical protein